MLIEVEFYGGLHRLFFISFFVTKSSGFEKLNIPLHSGVTMGRVGTDIEERKERIIEMQTLLLS